MYVCINFTYHNGFLGEMIFSWMFAGDYPLLKPMQGAAEILAARSVSCLVLHRCCKDEWSKNCKPALIGLWFAGLAGSLRRTGFA